MTKTRWAIAFLTLSLCLGSADALAGKGRTRVSVGLQRTKTGELQFNEKFQHSKGIRSHIPLVGRFLGRTMSLKSEIGHDGVTTTIARGREKVITETKADADGTIAHGSYQKRGFFTRFVNRTRMTRTDAVYPDEIIQQGTNKRFIGGSASKVVDMVSNTESPDTLVKVSRYNRDGQQTNPGEGVGVTGDRSTPYEGALHGDRVVERGVQRSARGEPVEQLNGIQDTYSRRWGGFWHTVTLGLVKGKRNVTVSQEQTAAGTRTTMRTPKEMYTRETAVGANEETGAPETISRGSYAKKGSWLLLDGKMRERSRDSVGIEGDVASHTQHFLRRNGTVKKIVSTRVFADGSEHQMTQTLRRDGTVRRTSIKAYSPREDGSGKLDSLHSVTYTKKSGEQMMHAQFGRVDGKGSARVELGGWQIGSRKISVDRPSGKVSATTPEAPAAAGPAAQPE